MKKFLVLILFITTMSCAQAFEIVYPKSTSVTINSPSTFFIGHISKGENLKINNVDIPTNNEGNFSYVVKLKDGENSYTVDNGTQKEIYKITKPIPQSSNPLEFSTTPVLTEYPLQKYAVVNSENSPLRTTPEDFGINRIAHLQKGVNLILTGEYENFYRVKLTNKTNAWIDKKYVTLNSEAIEPSDVFDYQKSKDNEFDTYEFYLRHKVPYQITENPLKLTIYNLDNKTQIFTMQPEVNHKLVGYTGNYEGDKFVLKVRKFPELGKFKPLKHINIVIDAGHGGDESGAIGCSGIKEKDINLQIAKRLKKSLKHKGAKVFMTRDKDVDVTLDDRVKFANDNDAVIFISIHANALADSQNPSEHNGLGIYYYYPEAKPLAESILNSVTLKNEINGDGIHQASFAVVRNTKALSILIETGYLINPDDNTKLETPSYQKKVVKRTSQGIIKFFKNN